MIARYVDKLLEKEKKMAGKGIPTIPFVVPEVNSQSRKLKSLQTKSVYTLCATFNEDLALLALALIDREIKVYRIK
jgi:hypothetical protein